MPLTFPRFGSRKNGSASASDPLDAVRLFALMSPATRVLVRKKLSQRAVANGKPLFTMGDPPTSLFVVQSGRFRTFVKDRLGQERVLAFVGPGEVLGEASFMADVPHSLTAVAVEPSRVWGLARADFHAVLGQEQPVLRYLAGLVAQRQGLATARLAAETAPDELREERGFVIALFSPRGGAGVTTLATCVGIDLAREHPDDVVLLDLNVLFGHVASALWLQPRGVLANIPPNSLAELDRRGLDYYLLTHESSLRVFPSSVRPEEGEAVTAEHVQAAVRMLRRHFGYVILDLAHNFGDVTISGLEAADFVWVVATPEQASLRDLIECRRIFHQVLALPEVKVHYALNHPHPYSAVPVADFAAATGSPWEEVPFGGEAPAQAALRGESLVDTRPGNPVSKTIARFGEVLTRAAAEAAALQGRAR